MNVLYVKNQFSEKEIRSFNELKEIILSLDLDEGVRILGKLNDYRGGGFIFINKVSSKFCINTTERIFDSKQKTYSPNGKEAFLYLNEVENVLEFIEINAQKPIRAWYY
jgi:hypothetical protein